MSRFKQGDLLMGDDNGVFFGADLDASIIYDNNTDTLIFDATNFSGIVGMEQHGDNWHNVDYALDSKVDTCSGTLQSEINGKAPTSHSHDDLYYTETELNAGQLDTRYYTEAEVNALIAQTIYTPSIVTVHTGTYVSGNVASVQTLSDSDVYRVREATGTPGYDIEFTISGVASFNRIWLRNYYEGSASHIVNVELYNTTTSGWDNHGTYNGAMTTYQFMDVPILDDVTKHIAAGVVRLRLWHTNAGTTAHYENIDYVAVVKAGFGATGNDHGALTGLGDDDHPQYLNTTRGDARYYTETEVDTISGAINASKAALVHSHDDLYYTEAEVNTISGNLNTSIGTKAATSHAVNASTYGYGDATLAGHLRAGTGLTTTTGTIAASFGATSTTICVGNDARLSDARTPVSHAHGNITNTGYIGVTATLPLITTTGGLVTVGSFSTGAGTFCQGNDGRLSDARTPTSHGNAQHSSTFIVAADVNYTNMNASSSVGTGASQVAKGDHTHDDRYYTETEVNTISGNINTTITTANTKIDTTSGTLQTQITNLDFTPYAKIDGSRNFTGQETFESDVIIQGNLIVSGTEYITTVEQLQLENHLLVINSGEVGEGISFGSAGIDIDRGTLPHYQLLFDESIDEFQVGISGSLETIATEPYVDTVSGVLQTAIDGKQASGDYATNSKVDTASGTLQTAITNISSLTYSPANTSYSSTATTTATAGETLAFGNVCYLKSDGKYWKSSATSSGSGMPVRAMALATISGNATGNFLVGQGYVRNDSWTFTTGGDIYASTSSGTMTQTVPATAGNVVQLLGYATASGTMMVIPDSTYIVRA